MEDTFYDYNKTHDVSMLHILLYVNPIDSRCTCARVYTHALCVRIYRDAHFVSNSLPASYASAASSSRVNCKVSGCREIWEPRAAAGIRAIHRMQICAGAFLGGGDYPHVHRRRTAFTTLILTSAVSSLRDTTWALALIQRIVIDPRVWIIG